MANEYGKDYYLKKLEVILNFYFYRDCNLKPLLNTSEFGNSVLLETINMLYEKKGEDRYIKRKRHTPTLFYQKVNELIPDVEVAYVKLKVKSFNEDHKNFETTGCYVMDKIDCLIAILPFTEEFAFDFIKADNIACSKYNLRTHTDNITFSIRHDPNTKITYIRIIISDELYISFSVCDSLVKS